MTGKRTGGTIYALGTLLAGEATAAGGVLACLECEDKVRADRYLYFNKQQPLRWPQDEPVFSGELLKEETCRVCHRNLLEVAGVAE